MKKKRIKILTCFIICAFCSAIFIGCNETKTDQEEINKINLHLNVSENEGNAIAKLTQSWSQENDIEVNVVISPMNTGGSIDEYLNITQNGSAPQTKNSPDIEFGLSHEFMEKLVMLDLAEAVPTDLIDFNSYISKDIVDAVTINNKVFSYPISQECPALFYNKNLVSKVPETMEKLVEDGKIKGFKYDINNFYMSYQFITAGGGYVFKNNNGTFNKGDLGLNNKGAIEGYEFLQDLTQKDKVMAAEINDNISELSFYNGESAYYIGEIKKLKMMKDNVSNLKFGVAPIPRLNDNIVKPFKGVKVALVNPKSNKKEQSYKLLKYIIDNSKEILISQGNRLPVFKDALELESFKNDEFLQGFYSQAKNSEIIPNILVTETIWGPAASSFNLLLTGQITPEECGENIVKEINQGIQMIKQ